MGLRMQFLSIASESFRRGMAPGAFLGAVAGLAPGILLVLVLSGGQYYVSFAEVLGFFVMSMIIGSAAGVAVGGAVAAAMFTGRSAIHSLRSNT